MKERKAVTKHEFKKHTERVYGIYINKVQDDQRPYIISTDVGCQYDAKRNVTCACENAIIKRRDMYYSRLQRQVYAYHETRSVTDIGVGSIKALQRKRVRRIYLPETDDRGIGSEDLSAFVSYRTNPIPRYGYYNEKKTSSKCVGGIIEYNTGCGLNVKLSPIVQTRSGATSPSHRKINAEVASNTIGKEMVTNATQVESEMNSNIHDKSKNAEKNNIISISKVSEEPECSKYRDFDALGEVQLKKKITNHVDRVVSSDSLIQHVHNLENPSDYKQSHTSLDPMENKLEKEYRKIFATKDKNKRSEKLTPDMKGTSILRRRFEALRRGVVKKEDSQKNAVIVEKESSQAGTPIRKDVSIASDPPSLEARSYSNTNTYSPFHIIKEPEKSICKQSTSCKKRFSEERDQNSLQRSQIGDDGSDCQGVKGMFKLWGKTFNLEEDTYKKTVTPIPSDPRVNTFVKEPDKKAQLKLEKTVKKDGRKFFFFKKKSKEKSKLYKSKKGLTAGRCEVGAGLTIKVDGNAFTVDNESKKKKQISEEILRKQWLNKYLFHAIESKNSVQIRWNNKKYATSSSTILELMDTVYHNTGIIFTSRSEVTTGESSYYKSRTQHVNFAHEEVEAWMIPKTTVDSSKQKHRIINHIISKDNTDLRMLAQKWFIDKAKAFSRKTEVVLHTKNIVREPKESSSEYLQIDIPKGFFVESSSDESRKPSSDEEVYKIIEYDTELGSKITKKNMEIGDHPVGDVKLIIQKDSPDFKSKILETVIKIPAAQRDVAIQGSDVNILKWGDVIGVGIITHRDLRETRKPILKIQDYITDDKSDQNITQNTKKCEFAESYLQDYYRHWTPLGIELFSWCVSDSHLICSSENSEGSFYNQGDGSKSCPNIYDDFQTSAIVSSNNDCGPRCLGEVMSDYTEIKPPDIEIFKCKWLKKLKVEQSTCHDSAKRVLPKDSFEVFKRRKIYASSDKSKWTCSTYCDIKPYSVPSIQDKESQGLMANLSKSSVGSRSIEPRQRSCRKHVSMKEDGRCEYISETSHANSLMLRVASGCDVCTEATGICPKNATMKPASSEFPNLSCTPVCFNNPNPPCSPINLMSRKKEDLPPKVVSILCPHFPPCRKSQSSQKSLDTSRNYLQKCPEIPCCSKHSKKSLSCVGLPCDDQNKVTGEVVRTPAIAVCISPPCKKPHTPASSEQFPWPLKSEKSDQSTQNLAVVSSNSKRNLIQCNKDCPWSLKNSAQTIAQKEVNNNIECKGECGSRMNMKAPKTPSHIIPVTPLIQNTSTTSIRPAQSATPIEETHTVAVLPMDPSKNTTTLLNFKLQPSTTKTRPKECSTVRNSEDGVIQLSSKENITIRMKKPTPSTEEIREAMNIKVKNDDGNTLYERIDYRKSCKPSRQSLLGDMYKSSEVNRSTPIIIKNVQTSPERKKAEEVDNKSDASIANLVEIQFKIKITQGDKTTKLNIGKNKNDDHLEQLKTSEINSIPQDIFVVKHHKNDLCAKESPKNDVNIRIVIKNFKSKLDKRKTSEYNNDFAQKISDKFQTVSTGYSVVNTGQKLENVFSIHRATIDLTTSNKILLNAKAGDNKSEVEFTKDLSEVTVSTNDAKIDNPISKFKTDNFVEKSFTLQQQNNGNEERSQSFIHDQEFRSSLCTDSEDQNYFESTISNVDCDIYIEKPSNKEQKKELLKKVMKKAHDTKYESKNRMKNLRDMLKIVLTSDSSGHDEMVVTSNELLKDVTFPSLMPNVVNDLDDDNTSYKIGSMLSLGESKYYPTEEQNSACSKSQEEPFRFETKHGCMCSTLAEGLNLYGLGEGRCCCRGKEMKSEETSCDIKTENNIFKNINNAEAVEILQSKYTSNEAASASYSIWSGTNSNTNKHKPIVSAHYEQRIAKYKRQKDSKMNAPKKIESLYKHKNKESYMKTLNRNIALDLSDEDRSILLKATPTNVSANVTKTNNIKVKQKNITKPHILQSHATKKAVLEIYTEKTTEKDVHTVAKLPKFLYDKESDLCKYQLKQYYYNSVCKRNVVMMSVER